MRRFLRQPRKREKNLINKKMNKRLQTLLDLTKKEEASDLHISAGHHPILRVDGDLKKVRSREIIKPEEARAMAFEMMDEKQEDAFLAQREADFSYSSKNGDRFRVNVYLQRGEVSIALRRIPNKISSPDNLNLPASIRNFSSAKQGLVLVTGPASHGKSTTLATLINKINKERFEHIVTIEDPIEYLFSSDKSLIDQREVGQDTNSFPRALKAVFRQDPDVIMVGEMRDPETIETTITAAETGHLVFSTLHTNSASQTIHRIVDSFPADQQKQIRAQLSASLLGIVSQRLVPRREGGLIPACEIMINNAAVSNLIREGRTHELDTTIETSSSEGMISLNKYLSNLVKAKEVSKEDALNFSTNPKSLKKLID